MDCITLMMWNPLKGKAAILKRFEMNSQTHTKFPFINDTNCKATQLRDATVL